MRISEIHIIQFYSRKCVMVEFIVDWNWKKIYVQLLVRLFKQKNFECNFTLFLKIWPFINTPHCILYYHLVFLSLYFPLSPRNVFVFNKLRHLNVSYTNEILPKPQATADYNHTKHASRPHKRFALAQTFARDTITNTISRATTKPYFHP